MNRGYRELVGLQVNFSGVGPTYSIEHFYCWKQNGQTSPTLTMCMYEMRLTVSIESVMQGLRLAFAPAILSIWQKEQGLWKAEYLQFQVGAQPSDVGLGDDWKIWAEW